MGGKKNPKIVLRSMGKNNFKNSNIFFAKPRKQSQPKNSDQKPKVCSIGQKWIDFDVLNVEFH